MINPELKAAIQQHKGEVVLRPTGRLATIGGMVKMNQVADLKSGVRYSPVSNAVMGKSKSIIEYLQRLSQLFSPSSEPDFVIGEVAYPFHLKEPM